MTESLHEHYAQVATSQPDKMDAFWMPFSANRQFKKKPRLLASAKGMFYRSVDGREILDGTGGLWCCNAGHGRDRITAAVSQQIETMDFAPTFQMGHPLPFLLAERLAAIAPDPLKHVFYTNSGSESVDTALKIALAYHRVRGEGQRTRIIGREKGYHGVGFGGISVGGLPNNRKFFGPLLPGVDHMRHTLDIARNGFSKGLPEHGIELAEDLERIALLHDPSTIAAVIVEPISGSAGVVLPPKGYLERLRELCTKHGILLIFDEVITGFGRVGKAFAAQRFGVTPDLITCAKGLTNGSVPMGAVFASNAIHDTFMNGPEGAIELFHGYTYSGHPLACAAALATLDVYAEENLFEKAIELGDYWEQKIHELRGLPNVIDIRNFGLIGAIELSSRPGAVGARAYDVFTTCFHDKDLLIRVTGDVIALSPPLILEKNHIDRIFGILAEAIRETA
ncbi:aspartate aminotransferase family protein [Ahniella affigens]|uniref:Aspartate aminotransferase family protein n=2 Tax=Ahniella affigens TaxID=2021234 RepID=A0A2P1PR81_9GAMM|nr:aspartate aminotransferase family protein [Ahniella affigens]AVP97331.1 aspartate aminotransferase family protein [Ahniella affigens]